jgi:multisubunit Na+/H+ antiporter MnhC subunit
MGRLGQLALGHARRWAAFSAEVYPVVSSWIPTILTICAVMLLIDVHMLRDYLDRPVHLATEVVAVDLSDGTGPVNTEPSAPQDPIAAADSLAAIFAGLLTVIVIGVSVTDMALRLGAMAHWRRVRRETRRISAG